VFHLCFKLLHTTRDEGSGGEERGEGRRRQRKTSGVVPNRELQMHAFIGEEESTWQLRMECTKDDVTRNVAKRDHIREHGMVKWWMH
jgi:hypothetical protein